MFLLPGAKKQPTSKPKRKPAGDGAEGQLPLGGDLWKAGELSKDKSSAEPFDDDFVVGDDEREDEPPVDETESDDLEPSVDADEPADDGADADEWFEEPGLSDDADDEEEADRSGGTDDEDESQEEEEEDESVAAEDPLEDSGDEPTAESESEDPESDETEEEAAEPVEEDPPAAAAAAPEPPPVPPAEPKPAPRRRRKTPPAPPPPPPSALPQLMPWLGFAATIVAAFACATWFFLARPVLADRVLGALPGFADLQESVLLSRRIHLSAVEGAYQLIGDRETAFVISGYATSTAPLPVRDVKVRARLLGPDGGVIGEKSVYCGVATTPPVLSDLDSREVTVLQRIQPPPRFAIAPGEDAKFLAVFVDPPEGIAHYALEVVSASALQR